MLGEMEKDSWGQGYLAQKYSPLGVVENQFGGVWRN